MGDRRKERFDAFMAGARMAYEDCADFAEHMASKAVEFPAFAAGKAPPKELQQLAMMAETVLLPMAGSFRNKIELMESAAEEFSAGMANGLQ